MITDEVYEHIVFAPYHHVYAGALPEIADRVICCSSLSKTYSITGWRLGYLIGPENVIEGAKKVHDFLTVGAAAPLQEAAVVGLNFPQSYYDGLTELYTHKRQVFLDGLDRIGLKHTVPQGSYFVMVDISDFQKPGMRFHDKSDMEFCEWMIRTIGVAGRSGFELLPRAGQPSDSSAFCPQRGDSERGAGASGQTAEAGVSRCISPMSSPCRVSVSAAAYTDAFLSFARDWARALPLSAETPQWKRGSLP